MATLQIQKTRNAETVTKAAIDQKQSLEVVQTMLHGGLSSLSYLRNFFVDGAFDAQTYDMSDSIHPYKDYAAGKLVKNPSEANAPSTVMRILRRGRSKRVDTFLDWLEKGAFAALKAGHLHALQVYVHADPTSRERVIETYTFTIKYHKDARDGKTLASLDIDGPGNPLVSVQATNSALQSLLRQIMDISAGLPELPEKRFISMELFYVPGIKKEYKPQGWLQSTHDTLFFAESEGWERRTETLKELKSSFHDSTLRISSLMQPSDRALANYDATVFPKALQYGTTSSKQAAIDIQDMAAKVVELPDAPQSSGDAADTSTPSTIIEDANRAPDAKLQTRRKTDKETTPTLATTSDPAVTAAFTQDARPDSTAQDVNHGGIVGAPVASQPDNSLNTQSSNIFDMKDTLRGMMQPEHITQGDTQTQSLLHPPPPRSESTESISHHTFSPSKLSIAEPTVRDKPALSQTKATELSRDKQRLHQYAHELAKRAGRNMKKGHVTLCQCGYEKEEGDMVECTYCGTWQHLHCYGYTGTDDSRLPEDHTCYQCLLGDEEQAVLVKLQDLALKRRGMHLALQKGLRTQRDFATALELEVHVAGPVYQHLKNAGYVVPATGAHKAGYTKTGKLHFVAVREGFNQEKMLQNLFDPLMHIAHHYQLPPTMVTQHTTLTQRLLASQDYDMPPPATPASVLRKRNAMTQASGLDLRASMTPFQTPSRPLRSRQVQAQKRALEDDESSIATSPKRQATPFSTFKRLKSMQTKLLIDANGLPSSPAGSLASRH